MKKSIPHLPEISKNPADQSTTKEEITSQKAINLNKQGKILCELLMQYCPEEVSLMFVNYIDQVEAILNWHKQFEKELLSTMQNTHDVNYLSDLLFRASQNGALRALELTGKIKNTITLSEVKKQYGRNMANEARFSSKINWIPLGNGTATSGVYCLRTEFEKFLFNREFEFYKR